MGALTRYDNPMTYKRDNSLRLSIIEMRLEALDRVRGLHRVRLLAQIRELEMADDGVKGKNHEGQKTEDDPAENP